MFSVFQDVKRWYEGRNSPQTHPGTLRTGQGSFPDRSLTNSGEGHFWCFGGILLGSDTSTVSAAYSERSSIPDQCSWCNEFLPKTWGWICLRQEIGLNFMDPP